MSPQARRKVWSAVLIVGFFVLWEALTGYASFQDVNDKTLRRLVDFMYSGELAVGGGDVGRLATVLDQMQRALLG
jgi:hypothetical protein